MQGTTKLPCLNRTVYIEEQTKHCHYRTTRLIELLFINKNAEGLRTTDHPNTFTLFFACTYSMEQRPSWKANWFLASQEIPRILWNPKVHHRVYCPPPVTTLNRINSVHTSTTHFFKTHLNIILLPMPGPSKWSLSLRVPHRNPVCTSTLPHTCYLHRPPHSWFDHSNTIWWGIQINL